jgi:hypothetical protein
MKTKPRDRDIEVLRRHAAQLMEHFETVQIFVTRDKKKLTQAMNYGDGNFYARLAQAREFVVRQDEYVRQEARGEQDDAEDDDSPSGVFQD